MRGFLLLSSCETEHISQQGVILHATHLSEVIPNAQYLAYPSITGVVYSSPLEFDPSTVIGPNDISDSKDQSIYSKEHDLL